MRSLPIVMLQTCGCGLLEGDRSIQSKTLVVHLSTYLNLWQPVRAIAAPQLKFSTAYSWIAC
ncbi:hypothetical protein [Tumidithrix helvetica]|uniref:hypothetical protein n=1 Tax=Tumidithrix helvetica TaxID=3457545 RepID=UPI003CC6B7D1